MDSNIVTLLTDWQKFVICSVLVCIGVVSFVGNLLVIVVMLKEKALNEMSASAYIITLAAVDCFSSAYSTPYGMYQVIVNGPFTIKSCNFFNSGVLMCFGPAINLLVAISADRYWAICHPFSHKVYKDSEAKKWIIIICFAVGIINGSIPNWWNADVFSFGCYPLEMLSRGHLLYCSLWIIGVVIIISTFYVFIFKAIKEHVKRRRALFAQQSSVTQEQKSQDQEVQVAKTMSLIIGSFLFCWLPITINMFLVVVTGDPFVLKDWGIFKYDSYYIMSMIFTSMNALVDPIIYAYQMKDIRLAVLKLTGMKRPDGPSRENSQGSTDTQSTII